MVNRPDVALSSATLWYEVSVPVVVLCIRIIWFYLFVPETKGRSLEELDEIFEAKIPARKSTSYKCRIVEDARQDVFANREVQQTKDEA